MSGHIRMDIWPTHEQFDALVANFPLVSTVQDVSDHDAKVDTLPTGDGRFFRTADIAFGGMTVTLYSEPFA